MTENIVFCGVGGQGTILASRVISAAAMKKGLAVMSAEPIGMAQRGGSVFSHIRVGGSIEAPMFRRGSADIIIAFEPGEAVRQLPYLKSGGTVVCNSAATMPTTAALKGGSYSAQDMTSYLETAVAPGRLFLVDGEDAAGKLGNPRVLNMVLLGTAARSGALCLSAEDLLGAMSGIVPGRFLELNRKAFDFTV